MSADELRAALSAIAAVRKQPNLSDDASAEAARAFNHAVARLKSDSASIAPPAAQDPESESARYKRLVGLRASIAAVTAQLRSSDLSAERRAELQRDWTMLDERMREFSDDCANASERIPVEQTLLIVASQARSILFSQGMPPRAGRTDDPVVAYIDSVRKDLRDGLSAVTLELEDPLSMVRISGKRWEVEEAKRALRDALPAYVERMGELIEAERRVQSERQQEQSRIEELRQREQWRFEEFSTVNIDWKGGTLQELLASVKSLVECNVVLADPSVGGLTIPALSVRRVAPEVFFRSLQSLPLADDAQLVVTVVAPETAEGSKPSQSTQSQGKPAITTSPVIVIARKPVSAADSPSAAVTQRIFDLSNWPGADAKGIESLIGAIEFAMQADGSVDRVKVRYHEPSRILFAKGPSGSIQLIDEIVTAFRNKK
ncbi:MAG: hypothetical protein ACOYMM_03125 [Phycisphaerales bacterium]